MHALVDAKSHLIGNRLVFKRFYSAARSIKAIKAAQLKEAISKVSPATPAELLLAPLLHSPAERRGHARAHTSAGSLRRVLLGLIGALMLALPIVVAYKLSPILFPTPDIEVLPATGCNIVQRACPASIPGGVVALRLLAPSTTLAGSFQVSLTTQGIVPDKVEIDFAGVDMDMGPSRTTLKPDGNGHYTAETRLPACITGAMLWRATVVLHMRGQRAIIPYAFLSGTND